MQAIDAASKKVVTDTGDVPFDKLIIATGARPIDLRQFNTPGADLGGIYYLRNVADADILLHGVAAAKAAGNKAVIVGGGYIGMEVAAALSLHGLELTMVFPESRLMERFFTPEMAAFYERIYTDKGITLVKGELVTGFEGTDGKVGGREDSMLQHQPFRLLTTCVQNVLRAAIAQQMQGRPRHCIDIVITL